MISVGPFSGVDDGAAIGESSVAAPMATLSSRDICGLFESDVLEVVVINGWVEVEEVGNGATVD